MKNSLLCCIFIYSCGFINILAVPKTMFKFTSSDYPTILKTAGFVDKTLLIKHIIENPGVILITAPPRFGKSTNLNMLKKFLEIEVNEDGSPKTKVNLSNEPVKDTTNYNLFVSHNLTITQNKKFMHDHFGKTPVISADFRCLNIVRTFDQAVDFCREVLHNTFKDHKYLLISEHLTTHQKMFFMRWYNDTSYKEMSKQHIAHGLRILSVYLYKHFNKSRVFVIIDEHDSIIRKAMFTVKGAEMLRKIISLSVSMMSTTVRNNDIYVKSALISGVSDIPVFGFSELDNIKSYRFLEEHQYLDFYGLTKDEVDTLFQKPEFNLEPEAIKDAHAAYNGYQSEKGKKMYNIYSVLRFLKSGKVDNYWTKFGNTKQLKNVFRIPAFKSYMEKLINGKSISVVILEKFTVEDIIDLRNLLLKPQSHINYWPATLFNFLLKQGYLTFMPRRQKAAGIAVKKSTVKLPNNEIRGYMEKLK